MDIKLELCYKGIIWIDNVREERAKKKKEVAGENYMMRTSLEWWNPG
jgi:hypothetical protein